MAKNVVINEVIYNDVPSVNIPLANGGGVAEYIDTDSATALATDLRAGRTAYANGNQITGVINENDAGDVQVNGKNITVPAGLYDTAVTKAVADGSITPIANVTGDELTDTANDYEINITPTATVTAGYVTGNKTGTAVKKYINVQSKSVAPAINIQTVTPDAGKLLSGVTVSAVDVSATANESDVLNGKTFFAGNLTRKTGTATVPIVGQDSVTKVLSIG